MSWNLDFSKRIKLTIDHNKINTDSVDVIIPFILDGLANIFIELGNNSKKISLRLADNTECYVEISKWDYNSNRATIWSKIPFLSSSQDTILYLYYDNDAQDNVDYVDNASSDVGKTVWSDGYVGAWHFNKVNNNIIDSSPIANNGTLVNIESEYCEYTCNGFNGIYVDNYHDSTNYIRVYHDNAYNLTDDFEIEVLASIDFFNNWASFICKGVNDGNVNYSAAIRGSAIPSFSWYNGGYLHADDDNVLYAGKLYYMRWKISSGQVSFYINGSYSSTVSLTTNLITNSDNLIFGIDFPGGNEALTAKIYEIRLSNKVRPDESYYIVNQAIFNSLIDYGYEENKANFKIISRYNKRFKLTINHELVDSDLYNFPTNIYIEGIFNELFDTIVEDYSKILIMSENKDYCYTEVAYWDYENKIGMLCTKIPFISSTKDTIFYLYFGDTTVPNNIYTGATSSLQAKAVWSDNFICVYHFYQKSGTTLVDSSPNSVNGYTSNISDLDKNFNGHLGKVTNGYFFDRNDYSRIHIGTSTSSLFKPSYITTEALCKSTFNSDWARIIDRYHYSNSGYALTISNEGKGMFHVRLTPDNNYSEVRTNTVIEKDDVWHYLVATYQEGITKMYDAGEIIDIDTSINSSMVHDQDQQTMIGDGVYDPSFGGYIVNIRMSDIARTDAWVKASYNSMFNTFIKDVSIEELSKYNLCVVDDRVYSSTISGVRINDLNTDLEIGFIYLEDTSTVWANNNYLYIGTTTSGIYRSSMLNLYDVHQYKKFPDIYSDNVEYLHGSGDYLCSVTTSGINNIYTSLDTIIGTESQHINKCFQTSSGKFYYSVNKDYNFEDSFNNLIIITFDNFIEEDSRAVIQVPFNIILNDVAENGSDIKFITSNNKIIDFSIGSINLQGNSIFFLSVPANTKVIYMLYNNDSLKTESPLLEENIIVSDLTSDSIQNKFITVEDGLLSSFSYVDYTENGILLHFHDDYDETYRFNTPYVSGNFFCELHFSIEDENTINQKRWVSLRITADDGFYIAFEFYNYNSINAIYCNFVINGTVQNYSSTAIESNKFKVSKNYNNIHFYYYYNDLWREITYSNPYYTDRFNNNYKFSIRTNFKDATYWSNLTIEYFKYSADNIIDTYNYSISKPLTASYSEVHCVSDLSADWDFNTISHKFTSDGGIINSIYISDIINVSKINDLFITEDTSRYGGNVLFLATNYGATIIEEIDTDYDKSNVKYYLLDT